ncbi:MAG: hypothetical protein V3R56_09475 [Xanthomonadales bacterium]
MYQLSVVRWPFFVGLFVCALMIPGQSWSAPLDASSYPREFNNTAGKVLVHHPVIRNWRDFKILSGRVPLEVTLSGGGAWIGSLSFEVATAIHFDDRLVSLHNPRISDVKGDNGPPPAEVLDLVRKAMKSGAENVSLDYLLRVLPDDFQIPGAAKALPRLNFSPPRIVVSNSPVELLLIDGPPSMASIASTQLEFVVNTDRDIFHQKESDTWYVLEQGSWLSNNMLSSGDWFSTTELPRDFLTLQLNSDWPQVTKAMPPRTPQQPPAPFIISYEPTELIRVEGEAVIEEIPGTVLRFVRNTSSDLFLFADRYYLLAAGRWFSTKDLKRRWSAVKKLPEVFAQIPKDHEKSYVLSSVPGTREARLAMIKAAIPRITEFSMNAGDGLEVPFAGEPSFVEIQGTGLRRAENTPFQVIMHNNFYYLCHDGAWYSSARAQGPWKVATEVPEAIYTIPPTDPAYNVTFVRLDSFDDSSNKVAYSHTMGYRRTYSTGYSVVYGTGWNYPGLVLENAYGYPSYWRYPHSYGYGARYNPVYGGYGYGGLYGYGYGGYNYSATYRVDKAEQDWEWDLEGGKRRVSDYGPRNYVGSGRYVMPDGSQYEGENTRGSVQAVVRVSSHDAAGDLYTDPEGRVFRKTAEGWQQYRDGNWSHLDRRDQEYVEWQYQARQDGYRNYDAYQRQKSQ